MQAIAERNLRSVDLNLLVVFDALMTERNVTRAAERKGLSQPAVSKALSRLRDLFDDPLFVRRDRAMEPTARALELAGPIHGALADISRTLILPAAFEPATVQATVRIATIDLYHANLLPALVRHLRRHAPGIDLQVRANDCARLQAQLALGELDLAIAPLGTRTSELFAEPLWTDRMVMLVGRDNPMIAEPVTIEAYAAAGHLVDAGHVRVSSEGVGSSVVDAILAARGLRRRIVLVLPNSAGVPYVVAATDLVATLPSRIADGLPPLPTVRVLKPGFLNVEVSPHLFWHRRTHDNALQSWLRDAIRRIAAHGPDGASRI
jgi:DNA-binding transcriptional LysR family regulator